MILWIFGNFSKVIDMLLSDMDREKAMEVMHSYLEEVGQETRTRLIPIEKFVIDKGLNKNPEDYADAKSQLHVQVTLQLKKQGVSIRPGATVPYIICAMSGDTDGAKAGTKTGY